MEIQEQYKRDFTDDGRWFVEDTKTGRKVRVNSRTEGAFVLAEIFFAEDERGESHAAAFARILDELGSLNEGPL